MSTTSFWYAAIGTDGMRPVVWGLGESEGEALEDGRNELSEQGNVQELRAVPITAKQAVRIQRGVVDCKTLGI